MKNGVKKVMVSEKQLKEDAQMTDETSKAKVEGYKDAMIKGDWISIAENYLKYFKW